MSGDDELPERERMISTSICFDKQTMMKMRKDIENYYDENGVWLTNSAYLRMLVRNYGKTD